MWNTTSMPATERLDELAVADVPEYEGDVRGRRSPDCTGEVLDAPPAEVVEQDDLADADATQLVDHVRSDQARASRDEARGAGQATELAHPRASSSPSSTSSPPMASEARPASRTRAIRSADLPLVTGSVRWPIDCTK